MKLAKKRRHHSNQFKFKVALEALQGMKTINEIASQYNLHPNQVGQWKKQLLTEGPTVFSQDTARQLQAVAERESSVPGGRDEKQAEIGWQK